MKIYSGQFLKVSFIAAVLLGVGDAVAAQAPNPRSGGTSANTSAVSRTDAHTSRRSNAQTSASVSTVSRTAARRPTAAARNVTPAVKATHAGNSASARSATSISTSRGADTKSLNTVSHNSSVGRSATAGVVRSAVSNAAARSATIVGASRAASARATAVFENIAAIGGGYATCREAYASCMDQFCAKANDTYRRCFCSSKFSEFRDTEEALDQAKTLLMQFEDNNLNAVDKTAAEVNAMYTATVGEAAIKNDTSAAQSMLNEIGDLLSGKKKANVENTSSALGLIDFDFTSDVDDIWSGTGNSIFDSSSNDLSQLEGQKLYKSANSQCEKLITESCENDAVLTMSRSAYNIMISQDCNAYEKKINSQRESVKQTVRQAEKILRDARLEEYRAHNSADVNECLDKVKTAITQDIACGANYKKCLDYSGAYIDINGEPIYTPRLFQLVDQIHLDGSADVLGANPNFNKFLDDKRMFATTALDTCRDLADTVWTEFKRSAIIEIAQAQDAKIEEVKMSCVNTMAECYNTQSNALKNFDKNTAKYSGAMAASAAQEMCQDKVIACAALYGDADGCKIDSRTGQVTNVSGKRCGLSALLNFVDTVDNVRVAEGCETALKNAVKDTCTPTSGDNGYPWNCRTKTSDKLQKMVSNFAELYCGTDQSNNINTVIQKVVDDLKEELDYQLGEICDSLGGYWVAAGGKTPANSGNLVKLTSFYNNAFGGNQETSVGTCYQNNAMIQCLAYNSDGETPVARYDSNREECIFTDVWYKTQCEENMNGYYEGVICYVPAE